MKIENNILIIDENISDENIEEFITYLNQEGIEKVQLKTEEISSGIIQALWCSKKKIETNSEFLNHFFENVKVVS